MKKYVLIAAAMMAVMPMAAQETYENARLLQDDLNGTARYVGMGGAMEALGADISTIGTNPAGLGLFRHSTINGSFGIVAQASAPSFAQGTKTNVSFDQIGFVWASKNGRNSYLNFGFNFKKNKNFDYILAAAGNLGGRASQNALSFLKLIGADDPVTGETTFNFKNGHGTDIWTSQLDNLYYNHLNVDNQGVFGYSFANNYLLNREESGYIGEYNFNISGNINDRVFLGMTFGLKDVHYKGIATYAEDLVSSTTLGPAGSVVTDDERRVTGSGFDIKAGIIVRPVAESPFRIGAYVHTPTWYSLTTKNYTRMYNNTNPHIDGYDEHFYQSNAYDFKLFTPWKFGFSLGHTIGNYLAIGATYEYADYSSTDTRVNDGGYYETWYDWYGPYTEYYQGSYSDRVMNSHTDRTLKGVSTFKVGLEYKPTSDLAVRAGYNYVSAMYNSDGEKDGTLDSYGTNYASATDWTNWKSTNRFTLGIGYNIDKLSLDLAYQYSTQKGDFTPFLGGSGDVHYLDEIGQLQTHHIDNYAPSTEVKNNRHQVLFTIGYHF